MSDLAKLGRKPTLRVAGLMSGTSVDGVDVAVVDIATRGRRSVELLAFRTFAYPAAVRRAVERVSRAEGRTDEICHLNFVLGEVFADAVGKLAAASGIAMESIDLIGSHGQTIHHLPAARRFGRRKVRSTLQIGEPCVIAERTQITTVADFRPRDIAAGGEGAPLVPYADYVLLADKRQTRAVQNIGGIANVTFLPAGGKVADVLAFDTGPGNMIVDRVMALATDGRRRYDRGGATAARGAVNGPLLAELMRHYYLRRKPPKSTGREAFGEEFADAIWARSRADGLPAEDIVATVTAFTADSIADAYRRHLPAVPEEVILCGGGALNRTLVAMLAERIAPAAVTTTAAFGIPIDAKEAVSFAILAAETIRGVAGNVPTATGAGKPVVLGKIIPA